MASHRGRCGRSVRDAQKCGRSSGNDQRLGTFPHPRARNRAAALLCGERRLADARRFREAGDAELFRGRSIDFDGDSRLIRRVFNALSVSLKPKGARRQTRPTRYPV